jgi:hypothetical protein
MSDNSEADETIILDHVIVREAGRRRCYDEGDCVLDMPLGASDEVIAITLAAMMRQRQIGIRIGRGAVVREFCDMFGLTTKEEVIDLRDKVDACQTGVKALLGSR